MNGHRALRYCDAASTQQLGKVGNSNFYDGIVESFNRKILDEFIRIAFRTTMDESVESL